MATSGQMDSNDRVTVRTYVMDILNEREKAWRNEINLRDKALRLQAEENLRRLHELNGAHERAQEDARTFVRKTEYDIHVSSERDWRSLLARDGETKDGKVTDRFRDIELTIANLQGRMFSAAVFVTVILASVAIGVRFVFP